LTEEKTKATQKTTIKPQKKTLDDYNQLKKKIYFTCLKIPLFNQTQGISRLAARSPLTSHRVIHRKSG